MSHPPIRIDDRLIHGQVTVGWVPHLGIEHIIVINDQVASEEWERRLYESAVPSETSSRFLSVREGGELLAESGSELSNALILLGSPGDLLVLADMGVAVEEAIVGGMHPKRGARGILDFVFVDEKDEAHLKELMARGVRLFAQAMPGGKRVDMASALSQER